MQRLAHVCGGGVSLFAILRHRLREKEFIKAQGIATVLSMDPSFRPDMIAMIAMSAAFMLTGAPFDGP